MGVSGFFANSLSLLIQYFQVPYAICMTGMETCDINDSYDIVYKFIYHLFTTQYFV